ncbi:hypothetical protein PLEOSDRAFT_160904 [Pleurotus ostreatus PC15]|uniref:DUF6533 domain-containing protein n=1 Tax=Pleurotus ostreatus (strain PC15) TaxID=1137138 RepID=A0A067NDM4_PLEO1|nr:hypothetical protein PLEOSDRAFT_160904 [Pleurotus ostreatus PC15]
MASKAATHYLQFDIQWSSLALLFYDYALTFPLEVKYIWGSKGRASTVLYIFCRYALVANVLYLLAIANRLKQGSVLFFGSPDGLTEPPHSQQLLSVGIFPRVRMSRTDPKTRTLVTFTGRIYAIYARNKYVLMYLSFLGLVCIALDITHVPGLRCVGSSSIPLGKFALLKFSAAVLTVIRCLVAFKAAGGRKNQSKGLMNLIFEQGVLYFSIVTIITMAALILNVKAPAGFLQRLLNAYLLPLSGLLTARFLLHIRVYEDKQEARALGAAARSQVHASSTLASFRAAAGDMVSGLVSQFGDDPVETVQRGTVAGESRSSAMSGGAGLSGDVPFVEPQSGHACGSSNAA